MAITIVRYDSSKCTQWDDFVRNSKNGTFLFERSFMEYHANRFTDYSLMAYLDNRLVALLPANLSEKELISHGGLTFGGWVTNSRMRATLMLDIFSEMLSFMEGKAETILYKAIPTIYHRHPAQEDLYALWRNGAHLVRRDISTAIFLREPLKMSSGRREGVKAAEKNGLVVRESTDFAAYHAMLGQVLLTHQAKPVHSVAELVLLKRHFPTQIRLFVAERGGEMLGGTICFDNGFVSHTQYLANSDVGRDLGALDLVLHHLATEEFRHREYLSFGISVESGGRVLNEGLISQKEGFGGRSIVHDFYEIPVA